MKSERIERIHFAESSGFVMSKRKKNNFGQKTYLKQQIAEIPPTMKIKDTITDTSMVTRLSLATSSSVSTVDTTCPWISSGHIVSKMGSFMRLSVTHLMSSWSTILLEKVWRYVLKGFAKLHEQDHIFSLRDSWLINGFEEAKVQIGKVVRRFPSNLKTLSIGMDSNECWAILTKLLFCRYNSLSDNKA